MIANRNPKTMVTPWGLETEFFTPLKSIRRNTYTLNDAVQFLKGLRHKEIAGIVTSPPYNKAFRGRGKKPGSNWKNSKLMADGYSHFDDNLPED